MYGVFVVVLGGIFSANYRELGLCCTVELELDETSHRGQLLLAFVVLILLLTHIQKLCVRGTPLSM